MIAYVNINDSSAQWPNPYMQHNQTYKQTLLLQIRRESRTHHFCEKRGEQKVNNMTTTTTEGVRDARKLKARWILSCFSSSRFLEMRKVSE